MNNLDKAFEIVKQGPALPVEVASKLGVDSFLANAYLSQLVETKRIRATKERVGSAFVYFLPGHEGAASSRVQALLQPTQKTARMFAERVPEGVEVEQKRKAFADRLQEIERKEQARPVIRVPAPQPAAPLRPAEVPRLSITEKVKQEFLDRFKPAVVEQLARQQEERRQAAIQAAPAVRTVVQTTVTKPVLDERKFAEQMMQEVQQKVKAAIERKKFENGRLVEKALGFLVDAHADVIGKELKKKGKEADIVVNLPTQIGNLRYLVLVRDKKTISEADLSLAFTEGQHRKLPVLFVTNGKLTKTAENYLSVISGLVKFKNL